MALEIKLCASVDNLCKEIYIDDVTPDWSPNNPGGYGGNNPSKSSITEYEIIIQNEEGEDYSVDALNILPNGRLTVDFDSFPTPITSPLTQIMPITAHVVTEQAPAAPQEHFITINLYVYCRLTKIVQNLFVQLSSAGCCDDCYNDKAREVMYVYNTYKSLEFAASTNNMSNFSNMVEIIEGYENVGICGC